MKKTLFLAAIIASSVLPTQAAVTLTGAGAAEGMYLYRTDNYRADDFIAVDVDGTSTKSVVTFNLANALSYVQSTDDKTLQSSYLFGWNGNVITSYGFSVLKEGDSGVQIKASLNGATWDPTISNVVTHTAINYATLQSLADDNGNVTLTIINTHNDGITISYGSGATAGSTKWAGLHASGYNHTTAYRTNSTYVSAIELKTAGNILPEPEAYISQRNDNTSVGRILFAGDSITHGVNEATWRWQLFKTFTDNGIENEIDGPRTQFYSASITEDAKSQQTTYTYGNSTFANEHLAQASGRVRNMLDGGGTYIDANNADAPSTGTGYNTGDNAWRTTQLFNYDTVICLMGTNDLLSDSDYSTSGMANKMQDLLGGTVTYTDNKYNWSRTDDDSWGNMGQLVHDLLPESSDQLYLMTIPTWTNHKQNNDEVAHYAVAQYNDNLTAWVNSYNAAHEGKDIKLIDINNGLIDRTNKISFFSHPDFFNLPGTDGIHPNEQGSLIIAGNLAKGMGIGGRTAGLTRANKNTADTTWHTATVGTDGKLSQYSVDILAENAFTQDGGYTVDFRAVFGNGSTDGWLGSDNTMSISIGDGTNSGTLNLSEGYIMWGTDVLFCADTSALDENLRIAWHNGNSADNVMDGYYVWLGDMLIGQGLNATTGTGLNGIAITTGETTGSITDLSWANTAYAPTTTGKQSTEYSYITQQDAGNSSLVSNKYTSPMPSDERNNPDTTTSHNVNFDNATTLAGPSGASIASAITSTTDTKTAKLASGSTSSWLAIVANETEMNVSVQLAGTTSHNIFGALANAANTSAGTIILDLTSDATVGTGTYDSVKCAIAGSYGHYKPAQNQVYTATMDAFRVYVNGGSIGGDIVGGSCNGKAEIGEVHIVVNNGTVSGTIYGGSRTGANTLKDASEATVDKSTIEVNGGTITGGIVAGGSKGTIGDVDVIINGGIIRGSISKGEATRMEGATTRVTVVGNKALIGGDIEADTVTLKDVSAAAYSDSFDKYANTITANKLVINNVQTDLAAKVEVSQIELTNAATTSLIMGDAASLETLVLDDNTTFGAFKSGTDRSVSTAGETTLTLRALTAGEGATLNANIVLGADSTLSLEGALTMGSSVELSSGMVIDLSADLLTQFNNGATIAIFESVDSLTLDGIGITAGTFTETQFNIAAQLQDVSLGYNSSGTVSIKLIPEPTTATLSLLALAALAARRRRR